jgi:geranylgeranyl pyrophosphate synthase
MSATELNDDRSGIAVAKFPPVGNSQDSCWLGADDPEYLVTLISDEIERRWSFAARSLDHACRHALLPTGKLFRPILMLESAMAVGGDPKAVLPAAIGAECGHVASLVHDDIIDGDDLRRGQPTVHRKFGTDEAIIAGDALIFHLFSGLAECRDTGIEADRIARALAAVAQAGIDMCRGQSMEAEVGLDPRCCADDYVTIVRLKTGAFFRGACECGAILGGGRPDWVEAVSRYGELLGVAFQIHDDLLGYTSDTPTMGKSATSDVRNRRFTLPVIYARAAADPIDRQRIDDLYSADLEMEPAAMLGEMKELLLRTGGMAAAEHAARRSALEARQVLDELPPSRSISVLARFAESAIDRTY